MRASLPDDMARTVACSIVGSHLDYCNSLLAGMSESNFHKLQCVENTLARVVSGNTRRDHITPVLRELHWLPVRSRVSFKRATLAFNIRQTGMPEYLTPCVPAYVPSRTLRSSSQGLLATTATRLVTSSRWFSHSSALPCGTTCRQTSDNGITSKRSKGTSRHIDSASPTTLRLVPSGDYKWLDHIRRRGNISSSWFIDWLTDWIEKLDMWHSCSYHYCEYK